ncbi:tyrosine-protein phosphatase [Nonomuraea deserti]|uniref:tyrosine-protein phosphatase n=1 Tax=Nonomuraea deserti TaxID=1848322 RepID=UPI0014050FEB|nr:tyrosine-protein phosphatase [Nonomuraea deserti]
MTATLTHLRDRYGGAEAYLLGGGLPPADVPLPRARLTNAPAWRKRGVSRPPG